MDILQAKVDKVKFTANKDPLCTNMLKAWSKLDVSHDLPIQSQYYYHNSEILGQNGDTLPVYKCLAKLDIKQIACNAVKYINSRVPDRHKTNNDLEIMR